MDLRTRLTPNRNVITGVNAPLLETALQQKRTQQQSKHSLIWGTVNVGILSIILYDIAYTCPLYISYVQYIEYVVAIILVLNILYHFGRYLLLNVRFKSVAARPRINMCLNTSATATPTNKVSSTPDLNMTPNVSMCTTPMNTSALSWMSRSSSPNESFNYPVKSDSWLYAQGSPSNQTPSPVKVQRQDTSGITFISDEDSLKTYLKDFEVNEKKSSATNGSETMGNPLSSFWSHPLTKSPKDVSSFLKRCQYQLSSPTTTPSGGSPKSEDKESPTSRGSPAQGTDAWRRLSVDIVTLTQWNANLRTWLHQTILLRLVKEFDHIDESLQKHGLNDIQIGMVGLDRLRKTAQTSLALQFIPTLPTVIPFLELMPNQEYLVKRIRDLAKGGCMSEFKWNSGGSFNGKDWDSSLPTDSAIMMHLFAAYMDTQLLPLPNQPDVKAFTGYHYLKMNEKLPTLTDQTLLIQQCSETPPHYRVIAGAEIFEIVKGYNNLFHSILLFLYFVYKKQHGMIGRVNLDRSGVNMLWIIQSNANSSVL